MISFRERGETTGRPNLGPCHFSLVCILVAPCQRVAKREEENWVVASMFVKLHSNQQRCGILAPFYGGHGSRIYPTGPLPHFTITCKAHCKAKWATWQPSERYVKIARSGLHSMHRPSQTLTQVTNHKSLTHPQWIDD